MTKPVALTPTYGSQSGTVAMSLFDGTFGQVQAAFNDYSTYAVYAVDVGAVNAMIVNTGAITFTLATGVALDVLVANTNTGPTTLNVSATGAIAVTDATGAALVAGTLTAGTIYRMVYDGTNYRAIGTLAASGGVGPGSFTTLAASGAVSGAGFNALFASNPPIGSTTQNSGAFTTLSATGAQGFVGPTSAKNVTITPTAGTGLVVHSVGGGHSTQIADATNSLWNAGYLGLPPSGNTTLALSDRGKMMTLAGGTLTCPFTSGFLSGDTFAVINVAGGSNLSIVAGTGMTTVRLAGTATTGTRTLGPLGMATIVYYSTNQCFVSGVGLT